MGGGAHDLVVEQASQPPHALGEEGGELASTRSACLRPHLTQLGGFRIESKFNEKGLIETLHKASRRPHTIHAAFDEKQAGKLREILHKSPRSFERHSSLWTLEMAAEVSFEEGLTKKRVSGETIRTTLERMGVRWQRAKRWITSPDPEYERKKAAQPTDEDGRKQPRKLGCGLPGRVLVEQGSPSGS